MLLVRSIQLAEFEGSSSIYYGLIYRGKGGLKRRGKRVHAKRCLRGKVLRVTVCRGSMNGLYLRFFVGSVWCTTAGRGCDRRSVVRIPSNPPPSPASLTASYSAPSMKGHSRSRCWCTAVRSQINRKAYYTTHHTR